MSFSNNFFKKTTLQNHSFEQLLTRSKCSKFIKDAKKDLQKNKNFDIL